MDTDVERALKRRVRRDRAAGITLPIEIIRECEARGVPLKAPAFEPAPAKKAAKKRSSKKG